MRTKWFDSVKKEIWKTALYRVENFHDSNERARRSKSNQMLDAIDEGTPHVNSRKGKVKMLAALHSLDYPLLREFAGVKRLQQSYHIASIFCSLAER